MGIIIHMPAIKDHQRGLSNCRSCTRVSASRYLQNPALGKIVQVDDTVFSFNDACVLPNGCNNFMKLVVRLLCGRVLDEYIGRQFAIQARLRRLG